jgi:hypothetical protein
MTIGNKKDKPSIKETATVGKANASKAKNVEKITPLAVETTEFVSQAEGKDSQLSTILSLILLNRARWNTFHREDSPHRQISRCRQEKKRYRRPCGGQHFTFSTSQGQQTKE